MTRVRAIGLPDGLFADVADQPIAPVAAPGRSRSTPSTLRLDHPREIASTVLAVLCWCRLSELTDSLVELFIQLVHRMWQQRSRGS